VMILKVVHGGGVGDAGDSRAFPQRDRIRPFGPDQLVDGI
jgi:hypothetical protein